MPRLARPLVTTGQLVGDLGRLGVSVGQTLLVHASLKSIGQVDGGAAAVVAALREAVGVTGNVVVPTGTEENSKTSRVHRERTRLMTAEELGRYLDSMPAFDKDQTQGTAGAVSEALRTTSGAARSEHPQSSLAAIGPLAAELMAGHDLECHLGEKSPLAKLYALGAQILLLGVGYRSCTAFHLAEYRYTTRPPRQSYSCVVMANGRRTWKEYKDVVLDDGDFETIGKSLEHNYPVAISNVGEAEGRLVSLPGAVDFASKWLSSNRSQLSPLCGNC